MISSYKASHSADRLDQKHAVRNEENQPTAPNSLADCLNGFRFCDGLTPLYEGSGQGLAASPADARLLSFRLQVGPRCTPDCPRNASGRSADYDVLPIPYDQVRRDSYDSGGGKSYAHSVIGMVVEEHHNQHKAQEYGAFAYRPLTSSLTGFRMSVIYKWYRDGGGPWQTTWRQFPCSELGL